MNKIKAMQEITKKNPLTWTEFDKQLGAILKYYPLFKGKKKHIKIARTCWRKGYNPETSAGFLLHEPVRYL